MRIRKEVSKIHTKARRFRRLIFENFAGKVYENRISGERKPESWTTILCDGKKITISSGFYSINALKWAEDDFVTRLHNIL